MSAAIRPEASTPLFVFELANNHEGSVAHAKQIIASVGQIARTHGVSALVKFQYRQLESFIHKDFKDRTDVKHIPRFLKNELRAEDFAQIADAVRQEGMGLMVTPFDEPSVALCLKHGVDYLKVASCSAADWPLLEAIGAAGKPVIVSTGGLTLPNIDNVVSFFQHKKVLDTLMHCVSIYPTPAEKVNLAFVERFKRRYSNIRIGYSGHESPDNHDVSKLAVAMGAEVLERHVGLPAEGIKLNAYSLAPEQVNDWVTSVKLAVVVCGSQEEKVIPEQERSDIQSLQRGVYLARSVPSGAKLSRSDVYFAMPAQEGQTTSGQFGRYRANFVATRDYLQDEPLMEAAQADSYSIFRNYIHQAKGMLSEAGIHIGDDYKLELSHHYGVERFHEIGATIVDVVNREYCKKLIVMLPGQRHPVHRHKRKEETFQLLSGHLDVELNDIPFSLEPGDKLVVERGTWHSFQTQAGAIFEEVSTTHVVGDSYYVDDAISSLDPIQRKTVMDLW